MNNKELKLVSELLNIADEHYGDHCCNDADEALFNEWTLGERRQFVKEFHDWNGDPEEYDENWLHLPDYALMGFCAFKILKMRDKI